MISVIVNTAALGPKAGDVLSSGKVPHRARVKILRDVLLPRLCGTPLVDEVIVVGEWHEPGLGDRWTYVPVASEAFDCTDALAARQAGFEAAHGNLLVFLHDDHVPAEDFFTVLAGRYAEHPGWDVLVPERRTFKPNGQEIALNNGRHSYIMGHASVWRRELLAECPWRRVPKVFTWDIASTIQARARAAIIRWVTDLIVYDAEAALGAEPWK